MEVDIMGQREPSLIKVLLSLGLSILMMVACDQHRQPHKMVAKIPNLFVQQAQGVFSSKGGVVYYKNQPFSGWQFELYPNGDTAVLVSFYLGKEHGCSRFWYKNRKLGEQRFYEEGRKSGEHLGWWENGTQRFSYHFQNGVYEGNQKEWNESGVLYKNLNFKNGNEEGLQQMWRSDGTLAANYVVKNGRNYGLAGVKNCKSVWENEKKN